MRLTTIEDPLHRELRDLHRAEDELVKALPKMAQAATNADFKAQFAGRL